MKKSRKHRLLNQQLLESALPYISPGKTEPLLDFLDEEGDSKTALNREVFFLRLDQATGQPLSREKREELNGVLTKYGKGTKEHLVGLIRDALGSSAKRTPVRLTPDLEDPMTRRCLNGMNP